MCVLGTEVAFSVPRLKAGFHLCSLGIFRQSTDITASPIFCLLRLITCSQEQEEGEEQYRLPTQHTHATPLSHRLHTFRTLAMPTFKCVYNFFLPLLGPVLVLVHAYLMRTVIQQSHAIELRQRVPQSCADPLVVRRSETVVRP